MSTETPRQAFHANRDHGIHIWWLDNLATIKLTGRETAGQCGIVQFTMPPYSAPPVHLHTREDELFYVVQGEMAFLIGDERIHAPAGTYVFAPREVAHTLMSSADGATYSASALPAGFEQFVVEGGRPAERCELPPADIEPPDYAFLEQLALKYGQRLVGPPPSRRDFFG